MKKLVLAGVSVLAVVLIILGSQVNIVGYQTVQASQQDTIKERTNQKEMVFKTIYDLANYKDIQKVILTSHPFTLGLKTQPITIPTLTKKQVEFLYPLGLILSKSMSKTKIQSIVQQHPLSPSLQNEFEAAIKNDAPLEKEVQQLSATSCHCNDFGSYPIVTCIIFGAILIAVYVITTPLWNLENMFYEKGMLILSSIFYKLLFPSLLMMYSIIDIMDKFGCFYGIP